VASNLACIGLAVEGSAALGDLITRAMLTATPVGTFDSVEVFRWQDPSGAALVLGRQLNDFVDLLPTYSSRSGGIVSDCRLINDGVATAALVDDEGEQLTAMAFEAEQYRQLRALGQPVGGQARITALGVSVQIHVDADTFASSPDSLLEPSGDTEGEPPAHYLARGWTWPPRVASESFMSYGAFGDPSKSTAHARLSGVVLSARQHVCELTGQEFNVATIRTVGFETDVCLAGTEHAVAPNPGNIVSGTVFLTAAIEPDALVDRRHRRSVFPFRRSRVN
jgi:hypothetical protein